MLLEVLERHVPAKVARCLDIGGGGDVANAAGVLRERFAEELYALDLGDDVERDQAHGVIARAFDVDQGSLPYPNVHFDLVLFASVIEHLYNPHMVLSEITRVLRPGGILLLEAPNAVALGRRFDALAGHNPFRWFNQYNALENKAFMEYCSVFYTVEEIESALRARFNILERRFGMHDPPVNVFKRLSRAAAFRVNPRLADWFLVVARRIE
jgi:SAM-dependent methyltransferase